MDCTAQQPPRYYGRGSTDAASTGGDVTPLISRWQRAPWSTGKSINHTCSPSFALHASTVRVDFDWDGKRVAGSLRLDGLHTCTDLLEALMDLGDILIGPGMITAAESQVLYEASDGTIRKMSVTKTKWAELRNCTGLEVRRGRVIGAETR